VVSSVDEDDDFAQTTFLNPRGVRVGEDESLPRHLYIVVIGDGSFATHPLPDARSITIGRNRDCDVPINNKSLSRRHAQLTIGDSITIEDLGSANGTVVHGTQLAPRQPVKINVGEVINLGGLNLILQQQSEPVRARKLCTHEFFEGRLDDECASVEAGGSPFAVIRVYADRHTPLTEVEEALNDLVRASDVLGKRAAHEYELMLTDTSPSQADVAVRRMKQGLRERGVDCQFVVACCPRDGVTGRQLAASIDAKAVKDTPRPARTDIVVTDAQMQTLHRLVEQIAGSQLSVLLLGETGVGKEVFARAVHRASPRAAGPFVELNCAALTESLLESELFGHEKGAFTNASSAKAGLVESADGGTLFLDEIGDMPMPIQAKLLRVIEDSKVRRVGSLNAKTVDVRIVAATNSNLETQIERGAFRRDLFFRLNGVTIVIPPLRDRLGELEALARAFIERATPAGAPRPQLTSDALELMRRYRWPGNVRELKHMMERAVLLCGGGPIRVEHLAAEQMRANPRQSAGTVPPPIAETAGGMDAPLLPRNPLAPAKGSEEEQRWIMEALEQAGGNQTLAARMLGISRRTLVNRLNLYQDVRRPRKDNKPR
jgi:two-component system, NtrC family, response regulator AtoC